MIQSPASSKQGLYFNKMTCKGQAFAWSYNSANIAIGLWLSYLLAVSTL